MAGDTESGEAAVSESEKSEGRKRLEQWLNKKMQIKMSDGRTLVGVFLCTDKHKNVILGSCQEYLSSPGSQKEEDARVLGLAMVPGHHIKSIEIDKDPTEEIET